MASIDPIVAAIIALRRNADGRSEFGGLSERKRLLVSVIFGIAGLESKASRITASGLAIPHFQRMLAGERYDFGRQPALLPE